MSLAGMSLAGRVLLLGVERIVVKRLGTGAGAQGATFLFFALGAVLLMPFALWEITTWRGGWAFIPGAMASGLVYSLAFVCYVRSLAMGEASLVSPLYSFNLFFLAALAAVFLGESLGLAKLLGLCLLILGAGWLSPQGGFLASLKAVAVDRACQYMMAASFLIAIGRLVDKSLIVDAPPMTYACLLYWVVAGYVLAWMALRGRVWEIGALYRLRPWSSWLAGAINGYSYLLLLYALTGMEVSVAEPMSLLGMVVTLALSKLLLGERIGSRLIGVAVMLPGAWLLLL